MPDTPVKIPQPAIRPTSAWIAAAGYLAAALAITWPLGRHAATHLPAEPFGDPLLNAWILGWDAERLAHGLRGLWQAPLFYPAADTLAFSEHLLGIAIFTAPVYWLSGNLVLASNVALIGSTVLAGAGMFLLTRELTGREDAAWVAGLTFACLPYRAAQIAHLQVLAVGWMPLALLGLHRYFRTGSRRALAGFAAAYVLQALSNGYFLFFLAVPTAIVAAWHVGGRLGRPGAARAAAHLSLAALAIVTALAPVAAAYLRVREAHGFERTRGEMVRLSATPASFASVDATTRFWNGILPEGPHEGALFPGATLGLLAVAGLAAWRRDDVRLYTVVTATAALLAMGPEPDLGFGRLPGGPYGWLLAVPGMSGLRVPARFAIVVYLGLGVLAAFGAARLLATRSRPVAAVVVVALSAAVVAEGLATVTPRPYPTRDMQAERDAYRWLREQPSGPMLELPVGGTREAVRYLSHTLVHGNRIVNGYSGHGWALQDLFGGPPSTEPGQAGELLRMARTIGLRYLVFHAPLYRDPTLAAELLRRLHAEPVQVERAMAFGTTTVFVLRPLPASPPKPLDAVLDLDACRLETSHNPGAARRTADGDVGTRWVTGTPQRGDEWLAVRCPEPRVITQVRFVTARASFGDYPRRLAVDRSLDGVTFEPLWEGAVAAELASSLSRAERPPAARIDLPPAPFRALRLRQTGRTPRRWVWAVDELELRGR